MTVYPPFFKKRVFLSVACADAYGAATEMMTPEQVKKFFYAGIPEDRFCGNPLFNSVGLWPLKICEYTGDTQAGIVGYQTTKENLNSSVFLCLSNYRKSYKNWFAEKPEDTGSQLRQVFLEDSISGGYDFWVRTGKQSASHGSLVRIFGTILAGGTYQDVFLDSYATHADSRCVFACMMARSLFQDHFDYGLAKIRAEQEYLSMISDFELPFENTLNLADFEEPRNLVPNTGYVVDTLNNAYFVVKNARDWITPIKTIASQGGDSSCILAGFFLSLFFAAPENLADKVKISHPVQGFSRGDNFKTFLDSFLT